MTVTPSGAPYRPAYIRAKNGLFYRIGVSTTMDAPTAHSALSGLGNDDHPQYLLPTEVIAGTNITVDRSVPGTVKINGTSVAGVVDHGLLDGLENDDHEQYHNDMRGDLRYFKLDGTSVYYQAFSATSLTADNGINAYIYYSTGGIKRWAMGSIGSAEAGASANPSDFRIVNYSDDGTSHGTPHYPLTIRREDGVVTVDAPIKNDAPDNQVATVAYMAKQNVIADLTPASGFKDYGGIYGGLYLTKSGITFTVEGMVGFTAAKNVTAGTEYHFATMPSTSGIHPNANRIWNAGVYSLTGSTAGSLPCRLRLDATSLRLYFMPYANGSFTTNGWVAFEGTFRASLPVGY